MSIEEPDYLSVLWNVYGCKLCPSSYGFSCAANGTYFKFPPTIGGCGDIKILFVGINPRKTGSNRTLHETLMRSRQAFESLAANVVNGRSYISESGQEAHYRFHANVVKSIFGEQAVFENVAAVTELFLCATANSQHLPIPESPCADRYLPETLRITKPKVIVAVGKSVMAYFRTKAHTQVCDGEIKVELSAERYHVIEIPHPGNPKISEPEKRSLLEHSIKLIKRRLNA